MKTCALCDFVKGWFIGDFEPALLRTKDFEVGVHYYAAHQRTEPHIHDHVTEYNVVAYGVVRINDKVFVAGDIFVIERGESAVADFLENTCVVIVKVPSVPSDKRIAL